MKLYTEEQMHSVILLALGRHGIYIPYKHYQDLIDLLTPIEIPNDEEIQDESEKYYDNNAAKAHDYYFELGAKWMRDRLQGDNK